MSADDLAAAVERGDPAAVVRILHATPEGERRALAPLARQLRARFEPLRAGGTSGQDEAASLAVYGTGTMSELRAARGPASWPPRHHEAEVLSGRPSSVVAPIMAWQLERFWGWHVARALVRDGTIPTPETDWYTLRLIAERSSPRETIAADPALLDDELWRLFEIEGSGEFCLAARDKYAAPADTWEAALLDLAAASADHRERLLDASLDALNRDFSTFRAGWFSRFHEALEPSVDERTARVGQYAALLRSPVKPTLTMAIAALSAVDAAGQLHGSTILGRLGQVLTGAASSTATSAIRLLRAVGARDRASSGRAARDLVDALAHPSTEVQAAALAAIDDLVAGRDEQLADLLGARMDAVAASRRPAAHALLERFGGGRAPDDTPVPRRGLAPPGPRMSPTDASRAVAPVTDLPELVELLAGLLESAEAADDVERALDGLARLGSTLEDDRLARPLRRRATTVLGRALGDRQASDLRHDVAALVLSWLDGEPVNPPRLAEEFRRSQGASSWLFTLASGAKIELEVGVDRFLARRLLAVAVLAAERCTVQLLASPTHRGGWIDPVVLAERMARRMGPPDMPDLVAALLRLGPERRPEALAAAANIDGEAGAALRHALAGDEVIGESPAIWAAAARARAAELDDPAVIARHPGIGPNAGQVARMSFASGEWSEVPGGLDLVLDPPAPRQLDDDQPATVMLVAPFPAGYEASGDPAMSRWVATVWPAGLESWAAVGAVVIGRNIDWWSAEWTNRIHLEALLDPWVEFGAMARALLGLGLGARERGERGLAADVAIAAIAGGRLDGDRLGDALRSTFAIERARPRRWAEALADVSAVSPDHAAVVVAALVSVVPSLGSMAAAERVAMLRLLRELVPQHPGALHAAAAETLRSLPGGGAAKRIVSEILAGTTATIVG